MGVVQDPQGAYVLVWQPKTHIGASLVNAPELGGTPIFGPTDIGRGKIGLAQDPQGACFALYAGAFEP